MNGLPQDWEPLLDRIQADLGRFLERTDGNDPRPPDPARSHVAGETLSNAFQQIHTGLDERLSRIEADLQHLDAELAQHEASAQQAQQAARRLRDDLSSFATRAIG